MQTYHQESFRGRPSGHTEQALGARGFFRWGTGRAPGQKWHKLKEHSFSF